MSFIHAGDIPERYSLLLIRKQFCADLPKDIALPPPTCIWRIKNIHTPTRSSMGSQLTSSTMYHGDSSSGLRGDFHVLIAQ